MPPEKAPEPDGFIGTFYKTALLGDHQIGLDPCRCQILQSQDTQAGPYQ